MKKEITFDRLVSLMPLVAHQEWKGSRFARNELGQCPICALVGLIDPILRDYRNAALTALGELTKRPLTPAEVEAALRFMRAADSMEIRRPDVVTIRVALGMEASS